MFKGQPLMPVNFLWRNKKLDAPPHYLSRRKAAPAAASLASTASLNGRSKTGAAIGQQGFNTLKGALATNKSKFWGSTN